MPSCIVNGGEQAIFEMNEFTTDDELLALMNNIDMTHLSYLQEDHNLTKLDEQRKLEALIKKYLTLVPPQKKFIFPTTRQILYATIRAKQDFSCYKTVAGWHGIATYAQNILTQPWRKEFRMIKMFNGFYKHTIEENLKGGEMLLELMGYQMIDDDLLIMFDYPVDPDQIAAVSKDALIASVECKIMLNIYAEVVRDRKDIKWIDVFMYREAHSGTAEKAIMDLTKKFPHYDFNPYDNNESPFSIGALYSGAQLNPSTYMASPHDMMPPRFQLGQTYPPDTTYHYGQTTNFSQNYDPRLITPCGPDFVSCPTGTLIDYEQSIQQSQPTPATYLTQTYQQNHHHQPPPTLAQSHPHNSNSQQQHRRSSSDHAVSASGADMNYATADRRQSHGYRNSMDMGSASTNAWGYEDKHWRTCSPPEQSPSTSGLGRGATLTSSGRLYNEEIWSTKKPSHSQQKPEVSNQKIDELELEDRMKDLWKDDFTNPPGAKAKTTASRKKKHSKDIVIMTTDRDKRHVQKTTREMNYSACLRVNLEESSKKDEKWSCMHCTFLNPSSREVCNMCGYSKKVEPEEPLPSGGRQCPHCTLVNKRGAINCDVCDAPLFDSPTYI